MKNIKGEARRKMFNPTGAQAPHRVIVNFLDMATGDVLTEVHAIENVNKAVAKAIQDFDLAETISVVVLDPNNKVFMSKVGA